MSPFRIRLRPYRAYDVEIGNTRRMMFLVSEWEGLAKLEDPKTGEMLIVTSDPRGPFDTLLANVFGIDDKKFIDAAAVTASPDLAALLFESVKKPATEPSS